MLPNTFINRLLLRSVITLLDIQAPISLLLVVQYLCYAFPHTPLDAYLSRQAVIAIYAYAFLETTWFLVDLRQMINISKDKTEHEMEMHKQERWILLQRIVQSETDLWNGFLKGWFYRKASPPLSGWSDSSLQLDLEELKYDNVLEFLTIFLSPLERDAENNETNDSIHEAVRYLEKSIAHHTSQPFSFPAGYNPDIAVSAVYDEPIITKHYPVVFYALTSLLGILADLALWLTGFRHFGPNPWFSQASGSDARHMGYWYKKGSKQGAPIVFCHGMGGIYGPILVAFALLLKTNRTMFIPEWPFVMLRLRPKSTIRMRRDTVQAVKGMLKLHQCQDAVFVGESLGTVPIAWVMRDAPELIAGSLLIEPSILCFYKAFSMRMFFRQNAETAGQLFFRTFAKERGIATFMCRYLQWSDSTVFPPTSPHSSPPLPITLSNSTNYGPRLVQGRTKVFLAEKDCIVPSQMIEQHLQEAGHGDLVEMMPGLDHAACLFRWKWVERFCKETEAIALEVDRTAEKQLAN